MGKKNQQKGKELKSSRTSYQTSTRNSVSVKTFSTAQSGFVKQASANGLLSTNCSEPPVNVEELKMRFVRRRESPPPPEEHYEKYVEAVENSTNEASISANFIQHLLKFHCDKGYIQKFDVSFTGYPKNVGFNYRLATLQPDFVEGLVTFQFEPFEVYKHISAAVIQENFNQSVALPHIVGEWKSKGKLSDAAVLQVGYAGAALVYSRNQALAHMGKSDPPGHAAVTTFITDGTLLKQYAHYAKKSASGETKYYQCLINTEILDNSYEQFKKGRQSCRNAQDYAKEQSYKLRDELIEHWQQNQERYRVHPAGQDASACDKADADQATRATTTHRRANDGVYGQEAILVDDEDDEDDEDDGDDEEDEASDEEHIQPYSKHQLSSRHSSAQHSAAPPSSKQFLSPLPPHQGTSSDGHKRKSSQSVPGSGLSSKPSGKKSCLGKLDSRSGSPRAI
ncbi:hypothetical protein SEPCBS57363_005422 [Sporothrix epigloea]|uniref:Uncharacterized protein n=1 Tax=Sporothrix epigloea TaxID=1892477 RepID=A0ABP0E0H3_9PEZI